MATLFENLVSSFGVEFDLALNVFSISNLSFVILAMGVVLIGLNAFLLEVCIFLDFAAGIAIHDLSFEFSCPMSAISAMSEIAYFAAHSRFSEASVDALSTDLWEYVRAIGLLRFWMKKDSAAPV